MQCPFCPAQCMRDNMRKHLNLKHVGLMTNDELQPLGFVVHAPCGQAITLMGMTRHARGCQGQLGEQMMQPQEIQHHLHDEDVGEPPPGIPVEQPDQPLPVQVGPEVPAIQLNPGLDLGDYADNGPALDMYVALAHRPAVPTGRLHPAIRASLGQAVQAACQRYLEDHSELNLLRILCLPKLGVARDIRGSRERAAVVMHGDIGTLLDPADAPVIRPMPVHAAAEEPHVLSVHDLRRIDRAISDGQLRKAAAVIRGQSGVATPSPLVIEEMRAKHPQGSANPFGNQVGPVSTALTAAHQVVLDGIVDSLDLQTSPGLSGWSPTLVKHCYGTPDDNTPFRQFLFCLAKQVLQGTAPGRSMLCAARLTALQQTPDKLRPIACGELFYRVVMRFLLRVTSPRGGLLPVQLGVGSPGGVSPIVELLQREYEAQMDGGADHERQAYSLDFSNAFNSVAREVIAQAVRTHAPGLYRMTKWAYGGPTPLVMVGGDQCVVIPSSQGVRQGDPLGPLLFSMAIRGKVERLQQAVHQEETAYVTSYLDDIALVSANPHLMPQIQAIFAPGPGMERPPDGIALNVAKTRVDNMGTLHQSAAGLPVLGSLVGNVAARRQFLVDKMEPLRIQLLRLRHLPRQQALLLLRMCLVPQLQHLLRIMDLSDLQEELQQLDMMVYDTLQHLRMAPPRTANQPPDPAIRRIVTLPISSGGFGLFSFAELRPVARAACREEATYQLLTMEVPHGIVPFEDRPQHPVRQKDRSKLLFAEAVDHFTNDLSHDQRLVFFDNSSKVGTAWMHAVPCGRYRRLSDRDVAAAINIRLLQADLRQRASCRRCELPNTALHHEVCGLSHLPKQFRHDAIRDKIATAVKSFRWIESEPLVGHPPLLQRADLRIGAAAEGLALDPRFGLVDLKVKCVLAMDTRTARDQVVRTDGMGLTRYSYNQIAAALEVAHRECVLHYDAIQPQPMQQVVPLVISSGGTMHKDFVHFLNGMVPNAHKRRQVHIDMALALVRARAQAYDMA